MTRCSITSRGHGPLVLGSFKGRTIRSRQREAAYTMERILWHLATLMVSKPAPSTKLRFQPPDSVSKDFATTLSPSLSLSLSLSLVRPQNSLTLSVIKTLVDWPAWNWNAEGKFSTCWENLGYRFGTSEEQHRQNSSRVLPRRRVPSRFHCARGLWGLSRNFRERKGIVEF